MRFRPCIDIHNGKVKQIVGGSLKDEGNEASENFVSEKDASYYATLYREADLPGGHIILLNPPGSEYYEADVLQARGALSEFKGGLQIGGGMNDKNAASFIDAGASHIIFTSFVFKDGRVDYDNIEKLVKAIGKEHIVLDLSCRKGREGDDYYIVTDRWQKFTDVVVNHETLTRLSKYCDEFLIHAVDVEGTGTGIESDLAKMLGAWAASPGAIPVTYAGGIASYNDIALLSALGNDRLDYTVGSKLDLFGGPLSFKKLATKTPENK